MAEANQIIFIEAFLASKKIKLTLFLQALFKALKTTITFWCFVFVTLFNLQGTRCVPQRFLMISLTFPFVKNFFQKLFSFFQVLSSARSWSSITAALAGDLIRIPHSVRLVKNFFEFFWTFFKLFRLPDLAGKNGQPKLTVCVGITYLSGPSPGKYFRQKRA